MDHQKAAQEAFRRERLAKGQSKEIEQLGAQETQAEEWTTPADDEKEVFFRNLLSAALEPRNGILGEVLRLIHILVIYQGLDTRMVFFDMGSESGDGWRGMTEEIIWWFVLGIAGLVGNFMGLMPVSKAYTPSDLGSKGGKGSPE